jgi:NAD(P)-dependent dehydrogenase (short-subunit alcohol dehydrogenase family)
MMELEGKVVVITGACGLLGKEFSKSCFEAGAKIILSDIHYESGKKLEEIFNSEDVHFIQTDITSPESVRSLILTSEQVWGKIDAVVNNAYPRNSHYGKKLEEVTTTSFNENLNLHLGGYFNCFQEFSTFFRNQGFGNIVSMGSIYGVVAPHFEIYASTPMTMPVEYAAIKSAIIHLTKYYAAYYKANNIRFNAISPGGIFNNQPEEFVRRYETFAPMLKPKDLCETLIYLLSDTSCTISGENFIVDGGWIKKLTEYRNSKN